MKLSNNIEELKNILILINELNSQIHQAIEIIVNCFKNGNKLLFCGNGGSAAEAQHIAAEYVSSLRHEFKRKSLPAIALTTDTSFLTATGNDFGFETIFERQIESLGKKGDVLIAISTSGNSKNIIFGINKAKNNGLKIIGFTGKSGGKMKNIVDVLINIPSEETTRIQECHLFLEHTICEEIENKLFNSGE